MVKLVNKIPGISKAQANWKGQWLKIEVRQGVQLKDEDVYDAIKRASFTLGKRIE